MAGNTFGRLFKLTSFGESHGKAIGGIIDGCPAGLKIDVQKIQQELDKRRPGQSEVTTPRGEEDKIEMLSGIFEGQATGAPIAFLVYNKDPRPEDYNHIKKLFRPSHADFTAFKKYGIHDYRGGGRWSGRETIARVAGGAIARELLNHAGITVSAFTSQIGPVKMNVPIEAIDTTDVERSLVRCPDPDISDLMIQLINKLKEEGDTTGGIITCIIENVPAGLGEPVFDKLQADLAKAMLSIGSVKGFEYGSGFAGVAMKGSEHNDVFVKEGDEIKTKTNYSGGIQGGISNGEKIVFNVAFKPVSTLGKAQQTIDLTGETITFSGKGRHDVCVVPRAVPVVEAMACLVLADHFLRNEIARIDL